MRIIFGLAIAAFSVSAGPSLSFQVQDGWLAERCAAFLRVSRNGGRTSDPLELTASQECFAYVSGFLDVATTARVLFPEQKMQFISGICVPDGVQARDVAEAIALYIEQHPLERNWAPPMLLSKAAKETLPCAR